MAKYKGRPGHNVRALARSRRIKAILSFLGAGALVCLLLLGLSKLLGEPIDPAQNSSSSTDQTSELTVSTSIFYLAGASFLVVKGMHFWKRARHADQGAQGEEDIAQALRPLVDAGWKVQYGRHFSNRLGDADVVCLSPRKNFYVIEVKSHRGRIIQEGEQLMRQMGRQRHGFEKDFLSQAMQQALQLKKDLKAEFVTPVVAFSNARVAKSVRIVRHVHVVEKRNLVSRLRGLDQGRSDVSEPEPKHKDSLNVTKPRPAKKQKPRPKLRSKPKPKPKPIKKPRHD